MLRDVPSVPSHQCYMVVNCLRFRLNIEPKEEGVTVFVGIHAQTFFLWELACLGALWPPQQCQMSVNLRWRSNWYLVTWLDIVMITLNHCPLQWMAAIMYTYTSSTQKSINYSCALFSLGVLCFSVENTKKWMNWALGHLYTRYT